MPGRIELSVVIPVYNGATTIGRVVDELHLILGKHQIEVVLVNDGSSDSTEQILAGLAERYPRTVVHVQLSRNFGEHSAVLAGLAHCSGDCAGIVDDDGQHPPEQLLRLWEHRQSTQADVVYGCYRIKHHAAWRNLGSQFHGWSAHWLLSKPQHLYLSSFKVISRFVIDQIATTSNPFPHLDGLILQTTNRLAQLEVEHTPSASPASRYNLRRLAGLWWNLCVGYSLAPLRLSVGVGMMGLVAMGLLPVATSVLGTPELWLITHFVLLALIGLECACLAILGDYVGRVALQANGCKPYIVQYVRRGVLSHV